MKWIRQTFGLMVKILRVDLISDSECLFQPNEAMRYHKIQELN